VKFFDKILRGNKINAILQVKQRVTTIEDCKDYKVFIYMLLHIYLTLTEQINNNNIKY